MLTRRFATAVAPTRVQKGAVLRHEGRFVQITNAQSNPVGTKFEFVEVHDKLVSGKFRVKSYDQVNLVDEEFCVEVEKVDEENDTIHTTTATYERIKVPLSLLTADEKKPVPGSILAIMMDEGAFVKIKVNKATSSKPKWQT